MTARFLRRCCGPTVRLLNRRKKTTRHALRRSWATWVIHAGADPKSVQAQLRHSRIGRTLLDYIKQLGLAENTIVVFSGDNGPEEAQPWRGTAGYFEGSYFTGMEGSLQTPAIVRYPGHVPAGQKSNDIVHITDRFTTLLLWAGLQVPKDRVIDGIDQRSFFEGKQPHSNRDGFPFWLGSELYGVK